ncbi:glycerophosphodiester phosphodiesterase [Paenarthrobacter sp. NCHU4564]|uniref:glycerophosphodiester phosphodiesterase n=1 Tax=Paenarthrobacter sp. NCHU4564 TaxID=3451353 RepID=UPI003F9914CD
MVEIQGHRGVLASHHGNTIAGFVEALRLGVDAIEVDIWLTADGQLALRHDAVIDGLDIRMTALRQSGVEMHPATTTEIRGERRTPTLEELLALLRFAAAPSVVLDIEVKNDGTPWGQYGEAVISSLVRVLSAHEHEQSLRVRSFDPRIIRAMAGLLPRIPMVALSRKVTEPSSALYPYEPAALIEAALASGANAVAPEYGILSAALVAKARTARLAVYPWTLVTAEEISEAVRLGVEGVCVNDVEMARETLAGLGHKLPEPKSINLPMLGVGDGKEVESR